jgi:BirA family biotin operon repressor/biotin-[acetyl-CoA-carboxylase] ligase
VFTPDRPFDGADLLLKLGALALFDAVAVLAPPQVPVHILAPDGLAVDGGRVATLRAAQPTCHADAIPDWAVLGIDVAVGPQEGAPGDTPDRTSLAEEGFGNVTPADELTHMSRHLLGWIDSWQQHGGAALQREVAPRTLRSKVPA